MEKVYEELREKLETIGFGYPAGDERGFEYPILTSLFTPEEAALFCAMPNGYQSAEDMAAILGEPADEVEQKLEAMSLRGNLFRLRTEEGNRYRTIPMVHGIYEFSIPRVDPNWVAPFIGYVLTPGSMGERVYGTDVPLLRTIPGAGTIEEGTDVMLLDDIDALIKSKKTIALAKCLCRISMPIIGAPECKHELKTCMAFDEFADYYVENGIGEYIDTETALEICHKGNKAGLMHQVGTSQRGEVLCNCCKCCCAVNACLRLFGGEASKVAGNYYAVNDPDACTQCGTCVERCPMEAITLDEETGIQIDTTKCIGCGVCASGCNFDAMFCRKKDDEHFYDPPFPTIFDGYSQQQMYRGFPA